MTGEGNFKIEWVPINKLNPAPYNPRKDLTPDDLEYKKIQKSLNEFGLVDPLVVNDDYTVISGHQRLKVLICAGFSKVPCSMVFLDKEKEKALNIALNKISGEWDFPKLTDLLVELDDGAFDMEAIGFDAAELESLLVDKPNEGLTDDDAVPEVPEEPTTKTGDLYILGEHRLLCGDATKKEDVERLMDGRKADMVFTDPPYGMKYGGGRAKGNHVKNKRGGVLIKAHGEIIGDNLSGDALREMVALSIGNGVKIKKWGGSTYVCFTWKTYSDFFAAVGKMGLKPKACIVWDKKSVGLGYSHYRPQHEFIFYFSGQWFGDGTQSDVWQLSRGATGEYVHPTQKPVELIERALENSSKKDDVIYDCFGGSGSTLIACEKLNRNCRMMEIDPHYCDVIVKRWEEYTGKKAELVK